MATDFSKKNEKKFFQKILIIFMSRKKLKTYLKIKKIVDLN
jgi:hypothetical protein